MARKTVKRRRGRPAFAKVSVGRPSRRDDYVGPTPETLAKLRQDPLLALFERYDSGTGGEGEGALERAADEIRAVYLAVCGMMMASVGGGHRYGEGPGGHAAYRAREIAPFLAWAHATTYCPWAKGIPRSTLEAVIDLVVERHVVHPDRMIDAAVALGEYAKRQRYRGAFMEDE